MAQTDRVTRRYRIFRICTMPVGLVAAFWGAERPKKQQLNPPVLVKSRTSHIGGPGDRFEPYRWFSRTNGYNCLRNIDPKFGSNMSKANPEESDSNFGSCLGSSLWRLLWPVFERADRSLDSLLLNFKLSKKRRFGGPRLGPPTSTKLTYILKSVTH
jgi:hypothetical protein